VSLLRAFIHLLEQLTKQSHWDEAITEFFLALGVLGVRKWCGGNLESEISVTSVPPEDRADWSVIELRFSDDIIYQLFMKQGQDLGAFSWDDVTRLLQALHSLLHDLERLKVDAAHDPLTGVLNRRGLDEWFTERTRRQDRGSGFVLVYMDLDNFKAVNDAMGHAKGDETLVHVADALLRTLRSADVVARVGGDEFVFIIDHMVCHPDYKQRLQDIVASLSLTTYGMTATFGVVYYPVHGVHLAGLLYKADQSLYEGKAAGRNCIRFWGDCQT